MPLKDKAQYDEYMRRYMLVRRHGEADEYLAEYETWKASHPQDTPMLRRTKGLPIWYLTHVIVQ